MAATLIADNISDGIGIIVVWGLTYSSLYLNDESDRFESHIRWYEYQRVLEYAQTHVFDSHFNATLFRTHCEYTDDGEMILITFPEQRLLPNSQVSGFVLGYETTRERYAFCGAWYTGR